MRVVLYILGVVAILSTSCRKKIVHELTDSGEWKNYLGVYEPCTKLCVYNGEIYIGRNFLPSPNPKECLVKLSPNGTLLDVTPGTFGLTGSPLNVHDMLVFNNQLYICGDFEYSDGAASSVDFLAFNGSSVQPVLFSDITQPNAINDLYIDGNDLLIGGSFFTTGNPYIVTGGTDKLSNGVAVGLADRAVCSQFAYVQNNLYAVGSASEPVTRLDGSSWTEIPYPGSFGGVQEITQCVSFNNELFVAGVMDTINLKKYDPANGIWTDFGPEQFSGTCAGFEIIGGMLYAYGKDLSVSGTAGPYSSVVRYNGVTWELVGEIAFNVTDLVVYDGKILAATESGIFAFPF